jgi:hypothetical protein
MKHAITVILFTLALTLNGYAQPARGGGEQNILTAEEEAAGWKLLFDGHSSDGWRGVNRDHFPEEGWAVESGEIRSIPAGDENTGSGGDIITIEQYGDFELSWEWKLLTEAGNSGVKYYVNESLTKRGSGGLGLEYQILDEKNHAWMLEGKMKPNDYHTTGALYEFFPPSGDKKKMEPLGEWNSSRIISRDHHVEHWLNGEKVLEYERGGKEFIEMLKKSKFKDLENFGQEERGHILLQDHPGQVHFRNIKIREF